MSDRVDILLAIQVALLGMVTPSMRAVSVGWSGPNVAVRVWFNRPVSTDDADITSAIGSEVIAHLPDRNVTCTAQAALGELPIQLNLGEVLIFQRAP